MKTVVFPPPSGIGHTAYVGVIARPLTEREAFGIAGGLARAGLYVMPALDSRRHVLHLWPVDRPLTTGEEVTVLRAFLAKTDCRINYHKAAS